MIRFYGLHYIFCLCFLLICINSVDAIHITKTTEQTFEPKTFNKVFVQNQHGNIQIKIGNTDSISVECALTVELDSRQDSIGFFTGVYYELYGSRTKAMINLHVNTEFSSNYLYQSDIIITAPDSLLWEISNKFGNINCNAPIYTKMIRFDYGELRIPALLKPIDQLSSITFFQAQINILHIENAMIQAENSFLRIRELDEAVVTSGFSTWNISKVGIATFATETDNINILNAANLLIKGMYSECRIENIAISLETELSYGKLILISVAPSFRTININHSNVNTQLGFPLLASAIVNADVRFCDLQVSKSLKTDFKIIEDKGSKQIHGFIGNSSAEASISIISKFEDVYIEKTVQKDRKQESSN